jgi:heterodisulfide reductase subunit C
MDHADGSHSRADGPPSLAQQIKQATNASPLDCYQCGRCAAGCMQNIGGEMDISPTRIMRLIQLESAFGHEPEQARKYAEQAMGSETCWLCAGCQACTTRCPQGVDIAGTMDFLRQEGLRRGAASVSRRARDIQALHKVFLGEATRRGRIHELLLVMGYKLRTGHFLADAMLGPAMFLRGKLHLLPGKSPQTQAVRSAVEQLKKHHQSQPNHQPGK